MSHTEHSLKQNCAGDSLDLGSSSLPRSVILANAPLPAPMTSSIEGVYKEFIDARVIAIKPHSPHRQCENDAMEILRAAIEQMLMHASCIILEQLEKVPAPYNVEDLRRILQHGAFQINLDDFSAYWQGVGQCGTRTLESIFSEALVRSNLPIGEVSRADLIESVTFRLSCGYCDIPGFEIATLRMGSFMTIQYSLANDMLQDP